MYIQHRNDKMDTSSAVEKPTRNKEKEMFLAHEGLSSECYYQSVTNQHTLMIAFA